MTHSSGLVESDIPKALRTEASRFVTSPGWPIFGIENLRMVGRIAQFEVVNRSPLPFLVTVSARFPINEDQELWSDKKVEFIGPLGKDEWQLPVPLGVKSADIRVGILPFEIAVARQILSLEGEM